MDEQDPGDRGLTFARVQATAAESLDSQYTAPPLRKRPAGADDPQTASLLELAVCGGTLRRACSTMLNNVCGPAGPCRPGERYMLPPLRRAPLLRQLVGSYDRRAVKLSAGAICGAGWSVQRGMNQHSETVQRIY